jgi:hypothetical protein
MNQEAIRSLEALLPELFSPVELRPWLRRLPDGPRMDGNLPNGVGSTQLVYETVDLLRRYGLLPTPVLWNSLHEAAPLFLKPKVIELAAKFGVTITAAPNDPPAAPQPVPGTPTSPTKGITVLLLSASPDSKERLRVDQEFRKIIDKVRSTRFRELFRFVQVQAARFDDLQSALLEHEPHILHLSGHGNTDGSLQFEADGDNAGRVSKKRLLRLLKSLRDNLRLVIVNACHSQEIAREIPSTIDLAIGMNTAVPDEVAIGFAVSFYEALGYGRTVENAFDIAIANLDDDYGDDEIPSLFPPDDQDPEHKRNRRLIVT